ncbi:MAG: hypothetical protein HY880_09195, partial [Deltaproteobacteria bacterium]|nr:hypothetical protein [Deltaproteobacteria bacterium]
MLSVSIEPSNPAYHYLLGVYLQHETGRKDLDKAAGSYARAIALSPARPEYWLGTANLLEEKGESRAQALAIARALSLDPAGIRIRWELFVRHLKHGHTDSALRGLKHIIAHYPSEREKAFGLIYATDKERMLEALPDDVNVMTEYFLFLVKAGDTATLARLWERLSVMQGMDRDVRLRYADYMFSEGRLEEARREWLIYRDGEGGENLVWDSGFEKRLLGLGFDWRLKEAEGARIFLDREDPGEGTR